MVELWEKIFLMYKSLNVGNSLALLKDQKSRSNFIITLKADGSKNVPRTSTKTYRFF